MSFYLTLPSNSSMKYYDNTLTQYRTKLIRSVNLSGSWEVGLAEIQYPHIWYNITDEDDSHIQYEVISRKRRSIPVMVMKEQNIAAFLSELTDATYFELYDNFTSISDLIIPATNDVKQIQTTRSKLQSFLTAMLVSGRFTRTFEHKPVPEGDDKWCKLSIIAVDYIKSKYFTYNDEYLGPTDIRLFLSGCASDKFYDQLKNFLGDLIGVVFS